MNMFGFIIIKPDGKEEPKEFKTDNVISVGRDENCELCLSDSLVSRLHCRIFQEQTSFLIEDLESQNGTWVNGRRIKNKRELRKGDVVQVGSHKLVFFPRPLHPQKPQQVSIQSIETVSEISSTFAKNESKDAEAIVKPVGMLSNYLSEATLELQLVPTSKRKERLNRNLLTLYKITEQLVATRELDEILDYVMDQIFRSFFPSRSAILLRENEEPPVARKERYAEGYSPGGSISHTILKNVIEERVSILTDDASKDPRFSMGSSVVTNGIRSVMAAPIWEEETVFGVLYLDTLSVANRYEPEDLDLLTAMGHQTALAIQRWKLSERVRSAAIRSAIVRENLGRFHSPQVVDLILQGDADLLGAKSATTTIFFCDIVGSTALCESLSPSALQKTLNLFFKTINEVAFEEQGTLDKFIGDAGLVIFGAPLPQADAPERAVRCAIKIRDRLARLMKELPLEQRFKVRYGINTGQAVVGSFGSDERIDYTVLGLPVNIAARICRRAEPDAVCIGLETYRHVKDLGQFVFQSLGPQTLRGLSGNVELYEVKGFVRHH